MAIVMEFADIFDDGITTAVHIYSPTAVLVYVTITIAVVTEHPKKPVDIAAKRVPA
jgi:formate hydrogenlyase subunit 4